VFTALAGNSPGDLSDHFVELLWDVPGFAARTIEDRRDRTSQGRVLLLPEVEGKRTLATMKE
jgi:hypothetical protein